MLSTRRLLLSALAASFLLPALPAAAQDSDKPIRALLVLGGCCHDYAKQKDLITQGISKRANVEWAIAYDPDKGTKHLNPVYENADWYKGFDVIVHDECCADVKDLEVIQRILKPHKDGIPAVMLHCGMHSFRSEGYPKAITPWFELTGLQTTGHGPQLPIVVTYEKEHPVTKTLTDWTTGNEELYNNITGKLLETATPLARGKQRLKDDKSDDNVCVWTNTYNGKTKVFATTLGHNNDTVGDARYLDLITRGLLWSVGKLDEAHLKPAKKVLIDEAK